MTRLFHSLRLDPAHAQREIDEELAFHLDQLEQELVESGTPPDRAAALARRRFGDPHRIARQCRAIVLREQIMTRRIHVAVTVLLALALVAAIGVAWSMGMEARRSRDIAMMQAVLARESQMRADQALAEARVQAEAARAAQDKLRASNGGPSEAQPSR
ncbi:MAG: hypothetical protein AMXMBFR58_18850 [Phycisphaerae bacterium]